MQPARLAGVIIAAHVVVPALNGALALGNASEGALDRLLPSAAINYAPRLGIWQLAWRLFAAAPLTGVGIGEFAGAAFRAGLDPSLTQFGNQVWTSPHNLPLQLLAETGVARNLPRLRRPRNLVLANRATLRRRRAAGSLVDHRRSRRRADPFDG